MRRRFPPAGKARSLWFARSCMSPRRGSSRRCKAARVTHSDDPSNRDPRFTRARLRTVMPALAREGLDARCLARLAAPHAARRGHDRIRRRRRARRVGAGPVARARSDRVRSGAVQRPARGGRRCACSVARSRTPATKGRSNSASSNRFTQALRQSRSRLRRTLAGALVTLAGDRLVVERAPARRSGGHAPATAALRNSGSDSENT